MREFGFSAHAWGAPSCWKQLSATALGTPDRRLSGDYGTGEQRFSIWPLFIWSGVLGEPSLPCGFPDLRDLRGRARSPSAPFSWFVAILRIADWGGTVASPSAQGREAAAAPQVQSTNPASRKTPRRCLLRPVGRLRSGVGRRRPGKPLPSELSILWVLYATQELR